MNNKQFPTQENPPRISSAERGIALALAIVVLMTLVFLVLKPRSMDSGTLAIVRFLAAIFAGISGYLFSGTLGLEAKIPLNKTQIKSTGAFATFVLVLFIFYVGLPSDVASTPNEVSPSYTQTVAPEPSTLNEVKPSHAPIVFPESSVPSSSPATKIQPILPKSEVNLNPSNPKSNLYGDLKSSLINKNWEEADQRTNSFHPVELNCEDLAAINNLWITHSNGQFGYSVQREIWESSEINKDYTYFGNKVGWRNATISGIEQNRWATSTDDLVMSTDAPAKAPKGHLPFSGWQLKFSGLRVTDQNGNSVEVVQRSGFGSFMSRLNECRI
ncbi:MAG: GUN4 domain-containing protein [Cyanobacteria bacterium P01_G01_bin.54]